MSARLPFSGTVWTASSAEGRWSTLGPYYAMFPVGFVRGAVDALARPGAGVLDPFCGRGTVPFVAQATGRPAFGVDVNPVGWVFSAAKANPEPDCEHLLARLREIAAATLADDGRVENEFQEWAWCPSILAFLRSARRGLRWKEDRTDRTLMAIVLTHLHGKLGNAVSNQMRQSKAMAPDYAVRWWKERRMRPPSLEPVTYFTKVIRWRYRKGTPRAATDVAILLGDARMHLQKVAGQDFGLLLTSPPYCGVTNYRVDNWIRLWLLGDAPLPCWEISQRYVDRVAYRRMLVEVFTSAHAGLDARAVVLVRTDSRVFTRDATAATLRMVWPNHKMLARAEVPWRSQTALFGDHNCKPGETDLLLLPKWFRGAPFGFESVKEREMASVEVWRP